MKKRYFKPSLMIFLILSGLLPVIGSIFFHQFLSDWSWMNIPLHSVVEALGSFTALSLAVLILLPRKDKSISSYYICVSCALIGMGILDMFHAFTSPGDSFVWLHSMAVLVGSSLFAAVWLPDGNRIAQSRYAGSLPIVVAIMTITLGVFTVDFADTLPAMISQSAFTPTAKDINILGGLFFILAAVYFIKLYLSDPSLENFLFINLCLLNGWAGLLFQFSQMWYMDWWFWHLLRLVAYLTVISYMLITFQRTEEELRQTEKELDQFFNLSLDMFCIAGLDGYFRRLNMAWEKTLGFTNDELQAKPFIELVHPEDRKMVLAELQKLKAGVAIVHFENRCVCKDGRFRWLAWTAKPIAEENLVYAAAHDITERKHAEEDVSKLLEELGTIFDNIPVGIAYLDSEFRFSRANKFMYGLTGLSEKELIGRPCYETVGEYVDSSREDLEKICSFCKKDECFNTKRPTVIERPLGDSIVKVTTVPQLDRDGNISHFLEVIEDITERKLSEAALRENEERYRKLVEFSPDAIAIHSEGKIVFANLAGAKLLGAADPEQLIGKPILDIVHPDYQDIIKERLWQMREEGNDVPRTEEKFIRFDGSVIDVEVSATPFNHQDKHGMQVIIHDITERKRAEEQIKEQAALLDKAHDAIAVQDLENRLIYWSKGAQYLYGWTKEEAIGKNANELLYKKESPNSIEALRNVIEKGEWMGEMHQVTKSGKDIIIESRWTLVHDNKGKPKSILIINTDITEKKKLEAQLLRAQRLESIGTLASGVAHDINNVLSPIMLSLELLKQKFTDDGSQELIKILERGAQRGSSLVKQVQSFARGVEGERITLQVAHLTSEIRQIARETFPRSIEIRTDIPKELWTIYGDATQLHQVLMNLCVNARDAMPDGGILSIYAENIFIDKDYARMNIEANVGSYIVITVSDTGTGIPPNVLDRIFEPFFTTKQPGKGTGLGLSTAHTIVKSHGGFITVYSEVGAGTTFKVYLPAIKVTETQKAQEQHKILPAGHGELILVIDDEAQIRNITRTILETHGYSVITADDGKEAITIYLQHREEIKVILMDIMMPNMDGPACIQALHKINSQLKIIGSSGLTEGDKLVKVASIDIHTFLSKPYTAEKLLKAVYEALGAIKT